MNNKPYHLMTPAERTAARIAKNQKIDAKVERTQARERARVNARAAVVCDVLESFLKAAPKMTDAQFASTLGAIAKKI